MRVLLAVVSTQLCACATICPGLYPPRDVMVTRVRVVDAADPICAVAKCAGNEVREDLIRGQPANIQPLKLTACSAVGGDGRAGALSQWANGQCRWDLRDGKYEVHTEFACVPEIVTPVDVRGDSLAVVVPVPSAAPVRRYLAGWTKITALPAGGTVTLPPGTSVDDYRAWYSDARDVSRCSARLARVIDSGGVLPPGAPIEIAADRLTEQPPSTTPSAAVGARQQADATKAATNEASERALSENEVRTGQCSSERASRFQQVLQWANQIFSGGDSGLLIAHRILVASPRGTALTLDSSLGGEMHTFAVGVEPVSLTVHDQDGNVATQKSPHLPMVSSVGRADGFVTEPDPIRWTV